jgi:polyhydroxybutyrate depolymerase
MKTLLALGAVLTLSSVSSAADLITRTWKVGGAVRTALVHLPEKTEGAPVIFAFHGHGGTSRHAARKMRFETLWPEAIVIYPQGLPAVTGRDPEGKRAGWLTTPGLFNVNRDLAFFDAMLATSKTEWKADSKRIYATGHSNGAGFTFCLWGTHPDTFAAVAPVAGGGGRFLTGATPCPALIIGDRKDPIVSWESTQQPAIDAAKKLNGDKFPVEVIEHNEGHAYPGIAPAKIVAFFKKFALK